MSADSPARLTTPVTFKVPAGVRAPEPLSACLGCGAPFEGAYCATCGQAAVDLTAPTWVVVRSAFADALDLDGRIIRTARALGAPGWLTLEYLRGRRTPYLGPLKVALLATAVLTSTWVMTRGVDSHYYGLPPYAGGTYIEAVARAALVGSVAMAGCSWVLAGGRRRVLDEIVFALHLVAALALLVSAVVLLATVYKLVWGTAAATPAGAPALMYLLFLPGAGAGLLYIGLALRRVQGGALWAVALRAVVLAAVGAAAVLGGVTLTGRGA